MMWVNLLAIDTIHPKHLLQGWRSRLQVNQTKSKLQDILLTSSSLLREILSGWVVDGTLLEFKNWLCSILKVDLEMPPTELPEPYKKGNNRFNKYIYYSKMITLMMKEIS